MGDQGPQMRFIGFRGFVGSDRAVPVPGFPVAQPLGIERGHDRTMEASA
jgi:hypothetical protein